MQRDAPFELSDLQKALLEYEPTSLETALIEWTRANWPMAARGIVYARAEGDNTISGVRGVRSDEARLVLELAARIAISEREHLCRAIAQMLPQWLEETYGLKPADGRSAGSAD